MLIYNCSQGERKRVSLLRVLKKRKKRFKKVLTATQKRVIVITSKEKGFEKSSKRNFKIQLTNKGIHAILFVT